MKGQKATLAAIYGILIILLLLSNLKSCQHKPADRRADDTEALIEDDTTAADDFSDTLQGQSGSLRVALQWNFRGDADLHVVQPNGQCIDFQMPRDVSTTGTLDVDKKEGGPGSAENIFWETPQEGEYSVYLHYFDNELNRGRNQPGKCKVTIETSDNGSVKASKSFEADLQPVNRWVGICKFRYSADGKLKFARPDGGSPAVSSCRVKAILGGQGRAAGGARR